MAYIDKIFIRKISKADFATMYGLNKPSSGGGQTYIDAAGVQPSDLESFLEWGEFRDNEFKDPNDKRHICTIESIVSGERLIDTIEFAPRHNRQNYKISRQTLKYRAKAWHPSRGFPTPPNPNVKISEEEINHIYESIASHLFVYISRTDDKRYSAGYINSDKIPEGWPDIPEIRDALTQNAMIIDLSQSEFEFCNGFNCPFD